MYLFFWMPILYMFSLSFSWHKTVSWIICIEIKQKKKVMVAQHQIPCAKLLISVSEGNRLVLVSRMCQFSILPFFSSLNTAGIELQSQHDPHTHGSHKGSSFQCESFLITNCNPDLQIWSDPRFLVCPKLAVLAVPKPGIRLDYCNCESCKTAWEQARNTNTNVN